VWRPTTATTWTETQDVLVFEHEMRLEGEAEVELESGREFGAFE
jgi:hypothetical protein